MMGVWLVSRVSFGHYDGCLVSNVRLNDDNLTLDDEFHLATMMGVWLVVSIWLVMFSHYDGCLVSGSMMGVWLVTLCETNVPLALLRNRDSTSKQQNQQAK